jgi:hypothetical protein
MSAAWLPYVPNARRMVDTNEPMRDPSLCFGTATGLDAPSMLHCNKKRLLIDRSSTEPMEGTDGRG